MSIRWYLDFLFCVFLPTSKTWTSLCMMIAYLRVFMSFLFAPLLALLSISYYFVVLFDSTFINPLYAMCTPIF